MLMDDYMKWNKHTVNDFIRIKSAIRIWTNRDLSIMLDHNLVDVGIAIAVFTIYE